STSVSVRLGDGLGGFSGTTTVLVGTTPRFAAIGDFNNDGNQDLASANFDANTVSIRLGDGLGGFSGTTNVGVGTQPFGLAIGDFNNDGTQDFASANFGANTVSIRLGGCSTSTAANVSVSGRVLTADGRGLRNAIVTLTDQQGVTRRSITSSFGYYRFEDIEAGQTYVVAVSSKRYQFTPRVISVTDELNDLNFTAEN
ncbi:MAG: FG-GAP-like repeat-containing protein, partial [Pyrinomonadaceae bacterium]